MLINPVEISEQLKTLGAADIFCSVSEMGIIYVNVYEFIINSV